ncbi:hypothetical protein HPB51_028069 [Rhipicephalus microplus]|uniref:Uncharacterized protein n=1 Tax=Rhipicephalus microplus TaxID=6941 RepID=A0A9J6CYK1_RHIMP|nr:hypothetical protein HPB51_028069 [Rhipicephalus microplus]
MATRGPYRTLDLAAKVEVLEEIDQGSTAKQDIAILEDVINGIVCETTPSYSGRSVDYDRTDAISNDEVRVDTSLSDSARDVNSGFVRVDADVIGASEVRDVRARETTMTLEGLSSVLSTVRKIESSSESSDAAASNIKRQLKEHSNDVKNKRVSSNALAEHAQASSHEINGADEYVQPPEPPKDCPVNVLMDWASKMCVGGLVRLNDKQAYRVIGHFGRFELTQVDREAPISKFAYQGFDPIKTLHRVFLQKDFKKR